MGADVLEGMKYWAAKAQACLQPGDTCDGLLVFARDDWTEERLWAAVKAIGLLGCEIRVVRMPGEICGLSSTDARRLLVEAQGLSSQTPSQLVHGRDSSVAHGVVRELDRMLLPSISEFCQTDPQLRSIYKQQVASIVHQVFQSSISTGKETQAEDKQPAVLLKEQHHGEAVDGRGLADDQVRGDRPGRRKASSIKARRRTQVRALPYPNSSICFGAASRRRSSS